MRLARTALLRSLTQLTAVLALACGSEAEPAKPDAPPPGAELGRVSWSAVGPAAAALGRVDATAAAREALVGIPSPEPTIAGARLDLEGALDTTAGEGALMLEARFAAAPGGLDITATLAAAGPAQQPEEARALLRKGLGDLASALGGLARLTRGRPADWTGALASAEPDEQRLAAMLLGRGRVREAVPRLAELLTDPREPVAEAAADALVAIGDRAAVPLLIGSIRRGDLRSEVRVIEALARLGGAEAEAYLEMTAGGHEVEEVRNLSERALTNLRRSKPANSL